MAEALGTASAIITIWDLVDKARKMHDQIKSAPGAWKLYCDGLESLAHVQSVVKDMIQSTPHMAIPIIEVREGKSQNLVSFVNDNLETVRKQATNILDQHNLKANRSINGKRFLELLKFYKASYMFVLDEQEIKSLREAIESAKSTLQLALQLLFTKKLFSGERRVEEQLRNIRESMKKQAVTLEAIEKNKKLSQIPLRVDDGKVCESILKKVKETSMLRLGRPKKKSNRAFKALIKSGTATVSQLVKSEAQPSPGIVSQVITLKERDEQAETKDRTRDPVLVEATVGMYETNDEETGDKWEDQQDDNRPFPSESLIVVRREKPQERQYDLVWRDGDIFSIAIDTDMYKTAFGAQLGDYQTNPIFRLDYLLENLTDAEQGNEAQNDLEDLLALELLSPEESEAEPPSESLSIEIDCQSPTYAFIGNSVDLSLDLSDTTTSLPFCVWVVCDLQSCRMFVLQEPCVVPCKHVRLEVMDISTLQRGPHYTMTFRSMSYGMLLNEEPAIGTHTELKLESFNTCQKKNGCPHTVVEGAASPEACCVRPVNLRAWLGEDIVEMEAVASIEDGVAYDDSISVNSTLKDDRDDDDEDHEDDDNNNDDKRALNLLQAVMNGMANSSDIPARIELSVLVSYVKMVDKYEFGEIYLSRALDWVDALLPSMSTSFDENAIAWLWILWRFHIPSEFKRLSAIIAQQATGRFSLEHDIHGVEIPAYIIDAIDQKRIHALSWVKAGVDREIEFCKDYAISAQRYRPFRDCESQIQRPAMMVRYLTLETRIHLPGALEGFNPNFDGISFESTAKWIRSMMNSGDWMIRAVPPPVRMMPTFWNHLWSYVLGDKLREAEDTAVVSYHVQKELTILITRLEDEDWGLHLDHVSHETDI